MEKGAIGEVEGRVVGTGRKGGDLYRNPDRKQFIGFLDGCHSSRPL